MNTYTNYLASTTRTQEKPSPSATARVSATWVDPGPALQAGTIGGDGSGGDGSGEDEGKAGSGAGRMRNGSGLRG